MKKIFLAILTISLMSTICYAESYVIYNTDTKEIYSLSNEDDAVMPESGYTKVILKDKFKDIQLERPATDYLYKNKNFVKNISKIDKQEQAKIKAEQKAQEEVLINNKIREQAIAALKAEGVELSIAEGVK